MKSRESRCTLPPTGSLVKNLLPQSDPGVLLEFLLPRRPVSLLLKARAKILQQWLEHLTVKQLAVGGEQLKIRSGQLSSYNS